MSGRLVNARAKVNLLLRVLEREPSGYHGIATLFCALELADELTITVEEGPPGVTLQVDGANLGRPADNLVARAADAFLAAADLAAAVVVHLTKRIPAGGGLGGGSSNAAATLLALDELLPGRVTRDDLDRIAAAIGSDVPFFMARSPLAWGEGRGERLTPVHPLPESPVLLAIPPFPVATKSAYNWLDADREGTEAPALPGLPATPTSWAEVEALAGNDFERPVYRRHPELKALRDALRRRGARVSMLAGSGSTVFGVFEDPAVASDAAESLRARAPGVRIIETRTPAAPAT